jgi:hypothetical protein
VLPAPFFNERRLHFYLIKRHEPGAPFFPNGGYEVRDETGGTRSFDLDQVISYPARFPKTDKVTVTTQPKEKTPSGRRGRPALDLDEKARRDADKIAKAERSGGKRGRPASGIVKEIVPKSTGGRRGRPKLSTEQVAAQIANKLATTKRSGGKRGRPKN